MTLKLAFAALFLLLGMVPARAATSCTVTATTVAFGTVAFAVVNSTGTVTVKCTANDPTINTLE